jgi:hypothetical protein
VLEAILQAALAHAARRGAARQKYRARPCFEFEHQQKFSRVCLRANDNEYVVDSR